MTGNFGRTLAETTIRAIHVQVGLDHAAVGGVSNAIMRKKLFIELAGLMEPLDLCVHRRTIILLGWGIIIFENLNCRVGRALRGGHGIQFRSFVLQACVDTEVSVIII